MRYSSPFTLEQALEFQAENLKMWKRLLRPDVYSKLQALVLSQNIPNQDPYSVCRGSDIDNFVHNAEVYGLVDSSEDL